MAEKYYIRYAGRTQGPLPIEKLHELARKGRFGRAHQVSTDGENWQRASELQELFARTDPPKTRIPKVAPATRASESDFEEFLLSEEADANLGAEGFEPEDVRQETTSNAETLWYYTVNDLDQAPVPLAELKLLIQRGMVGPHDQIWTAGMSGWATATQVPELSPLLTHGGASSAAMKGIVTKDSAMNPAANAILAPQTVSPMAVASFVLGLLGICLLYLLGAIPAVVFGHIALKQIRESNGQLGGRGLALSGLILGYAVIAITVIFLVVIFMLSILASL